MDCNLELICLRDEPSLSVKGDKKSDLKIALRQLTIVSDVSDEPTPVLLGVDAKPSSPRVLDFSKPLWLVGI